jgi:dienelactone hydrolase
MKLLFARVLCGALALASATHADTGSDPAELARTYQDALVYVPDADAGARQITINALPAYLSEAGDPRLVVYMHGCSGIIDIAHAAGVMYAQAGYVFVAPDSFARTDKPLSCRPEIPEGGLHRAVLGWRQAEAGYALTQLRALAALAQAPTVLAGHSEGAVTVATFQGAPVQARVIEGWTCNAGWPEYIGLNAPEAEPVLSLVGRRDPWFRLPVLRGDCGEFMDGNDRSVVFRKPDVLFDQHWLSRNPGVQDTILEFLDGALTH